RDTRTAAVDLRTALQDAETGQRGYILTQDEAYLEPYTTALTQVEENYQRLQEVLVAYPQAAEPMQTLRGDIDFKLAEMARTIDLVREGAVAEAIEIVRTDRGKQAMDRSRTFFDALIRAADDRLTSGAEDQRNAATGLRLANVADAFVVFVVVGAVAWPEVSYTRELAKARQEVELANASLEER